MMDRGDQQKSGIPPTYLIGTYSATRKVPESRLCVYSVANPILGEPSRSEEIIIEQIIALDS